MAKKAAPKKVAPKKSVKKAAAPKKSSSDIASQVARGYAKTMKDSTSSKYGKGAFRSFRESYGKAVFSGSLGKRKWKANPASDAAKKQFQKAVVNDLTALIRKKNGGKGVNRKLVNELAANIVNTAAGKVESFAAKKAGKAAELVNMRPNLSRKERKELMNKVGESGWGRVFNKTEKDKKRKKQRGKNKSSAGQSKNNSATKRTSKTKKVSPAPKKATTKKVATVERAKGRQRATSSPKARSTVKKTVRKAAVKKAAPKKAAKKSPAKKVVKRTPVKKSR
jgi:DNA-binding protein HU-beta